MADDKSTYTYVPEMIRFYLGEEPILQNVPTCRCDRADDLKYMLEHLSELVVKEVHGSGGKGMLVGPTSSKDEIEEFTAIREGAAGQLHRPADPGALDLPDLRRPGRGAAPCRSPAVRAVGRKITIIPGGLTRVALKEGSLVVNSSQGGGTKDTWVLAPECCDERPRLRELPAQWRAGVMDLTAMP